MANFIPNYLGPNSEIKKMNKSIPQDLAGYQHIVNGFVEAGDVAVFPATRHKSFVLDSIGKDIKSVHFDVYRKMTCPKAGDNDKDWREARVDALRQADRVTDEDALSRMMGTKAKTDDANKPPLANLPWKALRQVAQVQAYGHKKYGSFHNYKKGIEVSRQVSCAVRHIADFMDGIDLDKESGVSHLAHAATRLLFALENIEDHTAKDDRYKKTK